MVLASVAHPEKTTATTKAEASQGIVVGASR
jgi:hypothetical protein